MIPSDKLPEAIGADLGYTAKNVIGTGVFSEVWLATRNRGDAASADGPRAEEVALKVFTNKFNELSREQLIDVAKTEGQAASKLRHPNVNRVLGLTITARLVVLEQEFASGGDLLSTVVPNKGLPSEVGQTVLIGIAAALEYIHTKHQLAHLDLKAENVLLGHNGQPKLADFDAAVPIGTVVERVRGTADVHPPEYLTSISGGYVITAAADVWALGLLAHVVWRGRYAWDLAKHTDPKYRRYRARGSAGLLPTTTPTKMAAFFDCTFAVDVQNRPPPAQVGAAVSTEWQGWMSAARTPSTPQTGSKPKARVRRIFGSRSSRSRTRRSSP